jgi:excisionase family DNA binding protein
MTYPTISPEVKSDQQPAIHSEAGAFFDTATVARFLSCTPRTVTRLCALGHLPAFRLGAGRTSWRISEADLMAFITRHGPPDLPA